MVECLPFELRSLAVTLGLGKRVCRAGAWRTWDEKAGEEHGACVAPPGHRGDLCTTEKDAKEPRCQRLGAGASLRNRGL